MAGSEELLSISSVRAFLRKNRNRLFSSLDAGLLHLPSVAPFYQKVRDFMVETEREVIAKVTEFYRARRPPLASRGRSSSTYQSVSASSSSGRENNEHMLSAHLNRRRPGEEEARHITERGIGIGLGMARRLLFLVYHPLFYWSGWKRE